MLQKASAAILVFGGAHHLSRGQVDLVLLSLKRTVAAGSQHPLC